MGRFTNVQGDLVKKVINMVIFFFMTNHELMKNIVDTIAEASSLYFTDRIAVLVSRAEDF